MRQRRVLTGILSILITAVMLLLPCAIHAGEAEESERFGLVNWYSTYSSGSTIQDSFYFSDDWFILDPEVQNDALHLCPCSLRQLQLRMSWMARGFHS